MKLTRRALLREVRVHETRSRLDSDTISGLRRQFADACARVNALQTEVDILRSEPRAAGPALADNVRLAHRAEQAERLQQVAEEERDAIMGRLLALAARHPHLIAPDEVESP